MASELDIDSFLESHGDDLFSSSSSDEETLSSFPRRTVDEILNDSSSSSPSPPKPQTLTLNLVPDPKSRQNPPEPPDSVPESTDWRRRYRDLTQFGVRSSSIDAAPLPTLFGGFRQNPKPGAALAAAVAASRTVLTPHAVAIKNRRARAELAENSSSSGASEEPSEASENLEGSVRGESSEIVGDIGEGFRSVRPEEELGSIDEVAAVSGNDGGDLSSMESGAKEKTDVVELESMDELAVGSENGVSYSSSKESVAKEETEAMELEPVVGDDNLVDEIGEELSQGETSDLDDKGSSEGEVSSEKEETGDVGNSLDRLVEDTLAQIESSRKAEKAAEKKLRASMKPLEWAEELEKRNASSGMDWEEGVAAQPMRLEGIRRGPPAVGYLQIDLDNAITRVVSSQAFRNDHGSPMVLAVHVDYIALGMSRGTVLVFPSKYSPHFADSLDSKMMTYSFPGERAQSPATSMCFNQQGTLLLVGYGDGHLTLWDVQKAIAVKQISGEHSTKVAHIFFLGQNPQITRQFKTVTGDCNGRVLLHTFSVLPLVNRFSISTQCLFDGKRTETVLCSSPLLVDDIHGPSYTSNHGSTTSTGGLGSMMGGVVGMDSGWKLFNEGSPLTEEGIVIFVTHQNALVIKLSPNLEVIEKFPRPDGIREGSMPYTAWKWAANSNVGPVDSSDRISWLAIAWDRKAQVMKLVKSKIERYRDWNLDSSAIGVTWLYDKMLVVLTSRGQLCLFSKDGSEIHRISFTVGALGIDDIVTYNTSFSNTYGNPEKSFHNSVAVRGATVYILGPMHLIVSRLLPWKERIQVLHKAGDWMGALDMSLRLYDGHADGFIDLPGTVDAIRVTIMPFLVELLLSYVDEVFSYISVAFSNQIEKMELADSSEPTDSSLRTEIEDQYARVGGVAVEFCVHIKRTDILFDNIFSRFVSVQNAGTFLEILEPYILKDMLGSLPPEIMQSLVEHYSSKGWLQRVEQCVLHMDISSLDFNQVVRLCREHGLYGALIYLFNRGLVDYRTPLEELLMVMQNNSPKDAAAIGYRMLVYLKYCFQGLAFPPGHGTLPSSTLRSVREELLQFLLEDSKAPNSQVLKAFKTSCKICPNLCYLLWMDTEATLEVLVCAFTLHNEPAEAGIDNKAEELDDQGKHDNVKVLDSDNVMAQQTVDTIVNILDLESCVIKSIVVDGFEAWPSRKDYGCCLDFIASLVSYKLATISRTVLKHTLELLTSNSETPHTPKRSIGVSQNEKKILALINAIPSEDWISDDVLHLCLEAEFFQVCGYIHETRGQYIAALDNYIKDLDEPVHAFAFVSKILLQLRDTETSDFESAVFSRIPNLLKLSRECTFFLVIDHFRNQIQRIGLYLRSDKRSLFLFLKTTMEVHLSGTLNFPVLETFQHLNSPFGKMKDTAAELETYITKLLNSSKILQDNPFQVTDDLVEEYLTLLCEFERNSVLKFLETFDNYRLEQCLRICQEYKAADAAAYLLERVGDVSNALLHLMVDLEEKIGKIIVAVESIFSEKQSDNYSSLNWSVDILGLNEVTLVYDILHASIGLCQRNSHRLDLMESESLWFKLLEFYSQPLKKFCTSKKVPLQQIQSEISRTSGDKVDRESIKYEWTQTGFETCASTLRKLFSQFIGEIIEGMVGYVPLPDIMTKLLSDNANNEFGDFRSTILRILGTYGYEQRILGTAKSIIEEDTFYTMSLLKKGASHAYAPQDFICSICNSPLSKVSSASRVRVYSCGHSTHLHCESEENKNDNLIGCPICAPKADPQGQGKLFFPGNQVMKNLKTNMRSLEMFSGQYFHEADAVEKPYVLHHAARFELLSGLQKGQKSLQIDPIPLLRLSPPAIYHEKIQQRANSSSEPSDVVTKNEKPIKRWQLKELKSKGSLARFPLKSNIFGAEKNKVRSS